MNQIARFYESNLKNAPQAVEYLKGRGLTGEVVKRFNIGYAPADWDQVRRRFGASREHEQLLISGGMLITRDSGPAAMIAFAIASCSRSVTSVAGSSVSVAGCWGGDAQVPELAGNTHLPQGAGVVRPLRGQTGTQGSAPDPSGGRLHGCGGARPVRHRLCCGGTGHRDHQRPYPYPVSHHGRGRLLLRRRQRWSGSGLAGAGQRTLPSAGWA